MKTDVWIASVEWDYPGVENDDTKLPIENVWFRLGYGDGYLGDGETARLQKIYEDQGIGFYGVFVPTLGNWGTQIANALNALRWTRGLQFDNEPYGAYLGSAAGLQAHLDNVLRPLVSQDVQGKEISLCYDPRPQWLDGWDFDAAVRLVDSLAPMVYTGMFAGQGVWGDPVKAIEEAAGQCPKDKLFRPILQAYQINPADTVESFEAAVTFGGKPQLFRRGVTPRETWDAIAAMEEGLVMVPGTPYPVPPKEEELTMSQYEDLLAHIRRLDKRIDQIPAGPPGPPGPPGGAAPTPSPRPRSHTVKAGDTAGAIAAKHGLTIYQERGVWKGTFVALNPSKPRSGDWNLIYPGEKFRVA